jgi:hypothetical protein
LNAVAQTPQPFPVAEGVGIFVGVVAWDVLSSGHLELGKAALIAAGGALLWYGARNWLSSSRRKRQP